MAKLIGVVGPTGSGKTTSIQTLDPKETYIINVAGKELPFKSSDKLYNRDNKNYKVVEDAKEILILVKKLSADVPEVKQIIIDDANYIMAFNVLNKASETGFSKFNMMALDMKNLIQEIKKLREDLVVYYFCHAEEVTDGEEIVGYKMKTSGKALDNQIVLEGLFTVVLYTYVETKNDKSQYWFLTNRYQKYSAKSPAGMFAEVKIPNDLKVVTDTIREYYN
jgi:uridine kinase